MKVLFSHNLPFALAHGGTQTLIEALLANLRLLGVDVEPERWWDGAQQGDVLHYFGRPLGLQVRLARDKGLKVVMTELLDRTAARGPAHRLVQRALMRLTRRCVPAFTGRLGWDAYGLLDALIYAVPWEWEVAQSLFGAPPERGVVIPHGLDERVLAELAAPQADGGYLVSVGTIDPRKNTVLLAEAARAARVPVVFLGKPYAAGGDYFRAFQARVDNQYVRYGGFVAEDEKFRVLRGARGFVLLSEYESGCFAVHEAAAAGLPMLLTDAPWAVKAYPPSPHIRFTGLRSRPRVAQALHAFHQAARRLPAPTFPLHSWREIAGEYLRVYRRVLGQPTTPAPAEDAR